METERVGGDWGHDAKLSADRLPPALVSAHVIISPVGGDWESRRRLRPCCQVISWQTATSPSICTRHNIITSGQRLREWAETEAMLPPTLLPADVIILSAVGGDWESGRRLRSCCQVISWQAATSPSTCTCHYIITSGRRLREWAETETMLPSYQPTGCHQP